jgi:hypothetical protein
MTDPKPPSEPSEQWKAWEEVRRRFVDRGVFGREALDDLYRYGYSVGKASLADLEAQAKIDGNNIQAIRTFAYEAGWTGDGNIATWVGLKLEGLRQRVADLEARLAERESFLRQCEQLGQQRRSVVIRESGIEAAPYVAVVMDNINSSEAHVLDLEARLGAASENLCHAEQEAADERMIREAAEKALQAAVERLEAADRQVGGCRARAGRGVGEAGEDRRLVRRADRWLARTWIIPQANPPPRRSGRCCYSPGGQQGGVNTMKSPELGVRIWIAVLGVALAWLVQGRVAPSPTYGELENVVISDNVKTPCKALAVSTFNS